VSRDVVLESAALRVTVRPQVGGTITEIRHKASGLSVLGSVPWRPVEEPLESGAAPDEPTWLTRYTGGWPLLFPNGGDACIVDGVFHGFHGEASISPWDENHDGSTLILERRMKTVPIRMRRAIAVVGDVVRVSERAVNEAADPVAVMWGHHPTFGSDLLHGEIEITTGARTVTVDAGYDPPANPLLPGARGRWPTIQGKNGDVDLRRPMLAGVKGRIAALAYLEDFDSAWIGLRRLDDAIAVILSWDAAVLPAAWLWLEFGGTRGAPWNGQARLIGVEPSTTPLAYGLAEAQRHGMRLLTLQPAAPVDLEVRLRVLSPSGNSSDEST
jgi:hypothetical protein